MLHDVESNIVSLIPNYQLFSLVCYPWLKEVLLMVTEIGRSFKSINLARLSQHFFFFLVLFLFF